MCLILCYFLISFFCCQACLYLFSWSLAKKTTFIVSNRHLSLAICLIYSYNILISSLFLLLSFIVFAQGLFPRKPHLFCQTFIKHPPYAAVNGFYHNCFFIMEGWHDLRLLIGCHQFSSFLIGPLSSS